MPRWSSGQEFAEIPELGHDDRAVVNARREHIRRQLAGRAGEYGFGLGAEGDQFLGVSLARGSSCSPIQRTARSKAARASARCPSRWWAMARKKRSKASVWPRPARKASFQGGDGLGVPTRSVLDDAQRVEVDVRRPGSSRRPDGPDPPRGARSRGRLGTGGQLPGSVVAAQGQPFADGGLVGFERERSLQIGDRGLDIVSGSVDRSAHGPIMGVVRSQADRLSQVVDCLREALQVGQGMGAMVVGVGVVGIALESRGVTLEQRCGGSVKCSRCPASVPKSTWSGGRGDAEWLAGSSSE